MRRFRQGATNRPGAGLIRPGAGYGRLSFGAPGPTQEVEPREEIEPEMFFDGELSYPHETYARDFAFQRQEVEGDTIIDLTVDQPR